MIAGPWTGLVWASVRADGVGCWPWAMAAETVGRQGSSQHWTGIPEPLAPAQSRPRRPRAHSGSGLVVCPCRPREPSRQSWSAWASCVRQSGQCRLCPWAAGWARVSVRGTGHRARPAHGAGCLLAWSQRAQAWVEGLVVVPGLTEGGTEAQRGCPPLTKPLLPVLSWGGPGS